jgi:hypothetical protein
MHSAHGAGALITGTPPSAAQPAPQSAIGTIANLSPAADPVGRAARQKMQNVKTNPNRISLKATQNQNLAQDIHGFMPVKTYSKRTQNKPKQTQTHPF